MNPAITVRPVEQADLPRVARLAAELVRFHHAIDPHRFMISPAIEEGYAAFFKRELANPDVVLVLAEERRGDGAQAIIGYAYGRLEPRDWNSLLDACGALHDIFVEEASRRAGTGEALVEAVVAELRRRGAPRVVLSTAVQNTTAQRLFERLGFRRTMIEMTREKGGGAR